MAWPAPSAPEIKLSGLGEVRSWGRGEGGGEGVVAGGLGDFLVSRERRLEEV